MDESLTLHEKAILAIWLILWITLAGAGAIIVCAMPASASTHYDTFLVNSISQYTNSGNYAKSDYVYNATAKNLNFTGPTGGGYGYSYITDKKFGYGVYSYNFTTTSPALIGGNYYSYISPIFLSQDLSTDYSAGNKYYVFLSCRSPAAGSSGVGVYKVLGGSTTALVSNSTGIGCEWGRTDNITIIINASTQYPHFAWWDNKLPPGTKISVYLNKSLKLETNDLSLSRGYASLAGTRLAYKVFFDDIKINETPFSDFICDASGCYQSGFAFDDPGVSTRWMFSDGTQYASTNVTKALGAGTWTVALNNQNVAGSSSEMKPDYLTVPEADDWKGTITNPAVINQGWTFNFWPFTFP